MLYRLASAFSKTVLRGKGCLVSSKLHFDNKKGEEGREDKSRRRRGGTDEEEKRGGGKKTIRI